MCSTLIELTVNYLKRGLAWLYDKSTFENDFVQNGSWKNFKRCRIQRFVELAFLLISKKLISNLIFWLGEILSLSLHVLSAEAITIYMLLLKMNWLLRRLYPSFLLYHQTFYIYFEREKLILCHIPTYLPTYLPTNVSFSILPPYHNFLTFFRWQIVINVLSKLQVYTYIHVICMV